MDVDASVGFLVLSEDQSQARRPAERGPVVLEQGRGLWRKNSLEF